VSTKPIILIHTLLIHTVGIGRLQAIWRKLKINYFQAVSL
jgi:hypothetical protein